MMRWASSVLCVVEMIKRLAVKSFLAIRSFRRVVPFNGFKCARDIAGYSQVGSLFSRRHFTLTICDILKLGKAAFFLKHASGPIVALYIRTRDSGPKVSGQKISNPNCSPRNTLDFRPVPRSIIHSSVTWVPLVPSDMRKAWSQPSTWSLVKSYWWVNHWNLSTTVRHKSWTNRGGVLRISAYLQSGSLDLSSFLSPEICQKWPKKNPKILENLQLDWFV